MRVVDQAGWCDSACAGRARQHALLPPPPPLLPPRPLLPLAQLTRGSLLLEEGGQEFGHAQLSIPLEGARKGRRVVDVCRQQMRSAAIVAALHLHKSQH